MPDMDLQQVFRRLGFTKSAGAVYEALAQEKKPLQVTGIAEKAGISRMQVYRSLAPLLEKNFVQEKRTGKRTAYSAADPELISQAFQETAGIASSSIASYIRDQSSSPSHIRFFSGFSGIRAVFDEVVEHTPRGHTFYRYTSERDLSAVNRYLSPTYRAHRDRKKLERLVISNPLSAGKKKPRLERDIRFIEPKAALFEQNIIQLIYGDRLAFINLDTEQAFVIEDKALADFQKVIFTQLFRKLR